MQPDYMPPVGQQKNEDTSGQDQIHNIEPGLSNYYDTTSKKVWDFFVGFFGACVVTYFTFMVISYYGINNTAMIASALICLMLAPIYYLKNGRKY